VAAHAPSLARNLRRAAVAAHRAAVRLRPAPRAAAFDLFLHPLMPALLGLASIASIASVVVRIARVRKNMKTLHALASVAPERLVTALRAESIATKTPEPRLIFLDVETPLCYTVVPGTTVLVSRGFVDGLDDRELAIVVRHELAHVARRDPLRGLLWHLAFAALLVPGFDGIERLLYDRRERQATAIAGSLNPSRFDELAQRVRDSELAFERSLGAGYAGAFRPRAVRRPPLVRPGLGAAVLIALLASHWFFSATVPVLERHHC